ncbi:hypothetical protein Metbo_2152 [Methanobacterium lacus]|uniref:HEPN AbiJ-N-terminal domain-containing protein n=2 Tax=Methanobacterium lacus (strain AL-21) TaxID=877455 RepID=F0TCA0_METLA|nr:hypothetical protein Metbo_2152 [Methanobacterium lacus]
MTLFSERNGYKSVQDTLKVECMDIDLRTSLWNVILIHVLDGTEPDDDYYQCYDEIKTLITKLFRVYWKRSLDELTEYTFFPFRAIKSYFFDCKWCEVYDFLEILVKIYPFPNVEEFTNECNDVLEMEHSGYRFVDISIMEITSEEEIIEIEEALNDAPNPVKIHLQKSLGLLSDRESPDYSNSIKESISAVESVCKQITGESLSLGQSLNKIEKNGIIDLHPSLKNGFKSIYGYTSDSDGIRHGLTDEPNLSYEDAKFMLVACSAFVNYLNAKWNK